MNVAGTAASSASSGGGIAREESLHHHGGGDGTSQVLETKRVSMHLDIKVQQTYADLDALLLEEKRRKFLKTEQGQAQARLYKSMSPVGGSQHLSAMEQARNILNRPSAVPSHNMASSASGYVRDEASSRHTFPRSTKSKELGARHDLGRASPPSLLAGANLLADLEVRAQKRAMEQAKAASPKSAIDKKVQRKTSGNNESINTKKEEAAKGIDATSLEDARGAEEQASMVPTKDDDGLEPPRGISAGSSASDKPHARGNLIGAHGESTAAEANEAAAALAVAEMEKVNAARKKEREESLVAARRRRRAQLSGEVRVPLSLRLRPEVKGVDPDDGRVIRGDTLAVKRLRRTLEQHGISSDGNPTQLKLRLAHARLMADIETYQTQGGARGIGGGGRAVRDHNNSNATAAGASSRHKKTRLMRKLAEMGNAEMWRNLGNDKVKRFVETFTLIHHGADDGSGAHGRKSKKKSPGSAAQKAWHRQQRKKMRQRRRRMRQRSRGGNSMGSYVSESSESSSEEESEDESDATGRMLASQTAAYMKHNRVVRQWSLLGMFVFILPLKLFIFWVFLTCPRPAPPPPRPSANLLLPSTSAASARPVPRVRVVRASIRTEQHAPDCDTQGGVEQANAGLSKPPVRIIGSHAQQSPRSVG